MSASHLLADCFVEHCGNKPNGIFCHIIHPDVSDSTSERKTNRELLQDAFKASRRLKTLGLTPRRPGDPPINVAILMRSGYACFVEFLGILLNRCQPVLISPRNSIEGVLHLIRESGTDFVITDRTQPDVLAVIRIQIPSLAIIDATNREHITSDEGITCNLHSLSDEQFTKEYDSVVYYLHTSGSTGHPKLVPETHRNWRDKVDRLSPYPGLPLVPMAPMFHTMGLGCLIRFPFGAGSVPVIVETKQPYTGDLLCRVLDYYPRAICVVTPTILDEIASGDAKHVRTLATAHRVIFAGAGLSQQVGDRLAAANVRLVSAFGSTETGQLTLSDTASDDPRDWSYVRFLDPEQVHFVPAAQSLFQLVVKPGRFVSPIHVNYSDPVGFCSGDIWKRHPTKPGLWKHMGRRGAVTVLSNGEKTDNLQLESLLTESPLVKYAIVFGEGRFQNGVIIQPSTSSWTYDAFMTSLRPIIEHVNSVIPKHSRLVKDLILIAPPWKPFILSDKATVRRHETLNQYEAEVEDAYAKLESGAGGEPLPESDDNEGTLAYIHKLVTRLVGKDVSHNADLFDHGMDSLMAINCRAGLLALARSKGHDIVPRNLVYQYPTIHLLFHFITSQDSNGGDTGRAYLDQILFKLENDWDLPPKRVAKVTNGETIHAGQLVVLLTGSTGTFGSQILSRLLESPQIASVYCLNRINKTTSADERQRWNMNDPALLEKHRSRVSFWDLNLAEVDLGLRDDAAELIRTRVTHIVHCAWEVNFNHTVHRFVDMQLKGVRNVVDLALSSSRPTPPRVVFLSSVAAVANYGGPESEIPEKIFQDTSLPIHQGYAEAKFLAERLLVTASQRSGLPVTIIRGGQLSGSARTGAWNVMEVIPIFFQSCHLLDLVPNVLPDVRWMPTDIAAMVLLDILLKDAGPTNEPSVFHLESAHVLRGQNLLKSLIAASQGRLKQTTTKDWLEEVKNHAEEVPASRLLDVYEGWLARAGGESHRPLSIERTRGMLQAAEGIPINDDLIAMYWKHAIAAI